MIESPFLHFFCEGHKFSAWFKQKKVKKEERNTEGEE